MKNQRFLKRLGFAVNGIVVGLQREQSLRTHFSLAVVLLLVLIILKPAAIWWAAMSVAATSVIAAELFNTSIEQLADHLHSQQHPAIKLIKDFAAGAVLITSIGALCVAAAFVCTLI